ncbi:hypothetical protein Daus18300_010222 [Diaporthe australafricana]|uniref:Phosphoglycerate mutase n=1 Tax=Diaporthe australafricana TaxID=127596 RepID=A0ABR3WAV0_9PEZI
MTLANPDHMGLNSELLSPCLGCKSSHPEWTYCGHNIQKSITEFNKRNNLRRRVLVYDLRHGEADHNAWKKVFGAEWGMGETYRRKPEFYYNRKKYCIIDPPLTARGCNQAMKANETFRKLRARGFPMPKEAFVSPLYRTKMTFARGLAGIGIPGNCCMVYNLREHKTGNCADILLKEYENSENPQMPPPGDTELETVAQVVERAKSVRREIFCMSKSDCIVRVTHSLLIRHNLASLAADGNATLLNKFMLDEGGIFAYVIEGNVPNKAAAKPLPDTGMESLPAGMEFWRPDMVATNTRPLTAFPNREAPTTPGEVVIQQAAPVQQEKTARASTSQSTERQVREGETKCVRPPTLPHRSRNTMRPNDRPKKVAPGPKKKTQDEVSKAKRGEQGQAK